MIYSASSFKFPDHIKNNFFPGQDAVFVLRECTFA
jgi:hypothetical protein